MKEKERIGQLMTNNDVIKTFGCGNGDVERMRRIQVRIVEVFEPKDKM